MLKAYKFRELLPVFHTDDDGLVPYDGQGRLRLTFLAVSDIKTDSVIFFSVSPDNFQSDDV